MMESGSVCRIPQWDASVRALGRFSTGARRARTPFFANDRVRAEVLRTLPCAQNRRRVDSRRPDETERRLDSLIPSISTWEPLELQMMFQPWKARRQHRNRSVK